MLIIVYHTKPIYDCLLPFFLLLSFMIAALDEAEKKRLDPFLKRKSYGLMIEILDVNMIAKAVRSKPIQIEV